MEIQNCENLFHSDIQDGPTVELATLRPQSNALPTDELLRFTNKVSELT